MSGFDDACLVDDSAVISGTSFVESSAFDSGAETDTDVSVVSTMSSPKKKSDLRNEQYLFNEIKAVGRFISKLNIFQQISVAKNRSKTRANDPYGRDFMLI